MSKWADYCISAVRYDSEGKHIDRVRVHTDTGDAIADPTEWLRSSVVSTIENGHTFITIFKNDGKWSKGASVGIINVNGKKYLRTDRDSKSSDNLGNLPTF